MKNEKTSKGVLFQFLFKYKSLILFILGLVFDLLTLGRIDRVFYLFQHAIYIAAIFVILIKFNFKQMRDPLFRFKAFEIAPIDLMQFFYGVLLSHYFYFYFRSSSVFTWFFLIIITLFLLLNELAYEKHWYLSFKVILFPFCTLAYLVYLVPILVGTLGVGEFYLSLMLFFILMTLLPYLFIADKILARKIWLSSFLVFITTIFLYQLRFLPPVPLHVTKSGVFTESQLSANGLFMKAKKIVELHKTIMPFDENQKLFYASRIFSPSNFRDKLYLEWKIKINNQWQLQDRIVFTIVGKEEGDYRGIAWKKNWSMGEYQVSLVTEDDRVLDSLYLEVIDVKNRTDWNIVTLDF